MRSAARPSETVTADGEARALRKAVDQLAPRARIDGGPRCSAVLRAGGCGRAGLSLRNVAYGARARGDGKGRQTREVTVSRRPAFRDAALNDSHLRGYRDPSAIGIATATRN
jgi:hypothetical protein